MPIRPKYALLILYIIICGLQEVYGYHTNYAVSFSPATFATWFMGSINTAMQSLIVESSMADRLYPLLTILKGTLEEAGYLHIQCTKPDTVGTYSTIYLRHH